MNPTPGTTTFPALGTTAAVVTANVADLTAAEEAVRATVAAVDVACSRFRDDSELSLLRSAQGRAVAASPLLLDALALALRAAALTDGLIDPTIGGVLSVLGYDRDFRILDRDQPPLTVRIRAVPGWRRIEVDQNAGTARVPAGVELDLGATAKAFAADRAAAAAHDVTGDGVLVSLGGDVAVAGPGPDGGWPVRLEDDHAAPLDGLGPVVAVHAGGLATSSTTVRRWSRGDVEVHHIVDPRTGHAAITPWRTVSVAAGSCADANIASTAAVILGDGAPAWLQDHHLPARLVERDGTVHTVGGWPADTAVVAGRPL